MPPLTMLPGAERPYHVQWTETRAGVFWTSPPQCVPSAEDARGIVRATTRLAGPAAAAGRTWTLRRCDGTCTR
jgi:hypothetical protein